ncbi:ligand-binding sensor domain-containing protein [Chitinophaga vietnamensis]|uniref:ligand-binding sensor domain-containing protein n=1 Tax=Chitinophaga vietnamensis TaxID=2593957 RepID=UPI001375A208|nr:two-component regulator propeller domain-containing protein [Chitinophaga vietnamensis]
MRSCGIIIFLNSSKFGKRTGLNDISRYCLLLLMVLSCRLAAAQSRGLYFENYTSQNGLSQNSCFAIAQDADGFMWFGTQDGLNRYDGKQFKIFLPQNERGKKLPSNYISSLFFDPYKKLLWVGTVRGACIYHPGKDSLLKVTDLFPFAAQLEKVPVKEIVSFRENEYWIITYNKGLLLLNTQTKSIQYFFDDGENRSVVSSIVMYKGRIIVALLHQLFYLLPHNGQYALQALHIQHSFSEIRTLFPHQDALWIGTSTEGCFYVNDPLDAAGSVHSFPAAKGGVGCFAADSAGNLWIGTRGNGIVRQDARSLQIQTAVYNRYDDRTPGKDFVLSLFHDRQNMMWCGLSGGGIAKYDPLKYQFDNFSNEPLNAASLPDNMIFDLYKSKDGQRYAGTQNKGLVAWNTATNQFFRHPAFVAFNAAGNTVYDMTEDDEGRLWIATWGGLICSDPKKQQFTFQRNDQLLSTQKLYCVHKLQHADSLFITGENGPVFFSLKDKRWKPCSDSLLQLNAYIGRYIYEDEKNILWICTTGGGLVKYDYRKGQFCIQEAVKQYSPYTRHLLKDGRLFWIATDNGIVQYDPEKKTVTQHITINPANSSGVCYAIQKDRKGCLWVSTNTGLCKIDPGSRQVQQYDLGDGLAFLEYNTACTLTDDDSALLFGGVGGITRFDPAALQTNTFSPDPLITDMQVNGTPLNISAGKRNEIVLHYKENFVRLLFTTNNFSNEARNQYAYRLLGLSDSWVDSRNNNEASYTSLPPGKYSFQLRSANSAGQWSKGITTLAFTILPPWWQSWWLRIAGIVITAGIVLLVVRRHINNIRYDAAMKQKIAETEMMALRAQMNPHFIFNCINSIDALIQSNDKYYATVYLNKFAKLLRNILDSSKQNTVTLARDLETLQLYIDLEKLRYENKFTVEIKADETLLQDDYKVPPLIVQPYVENAILHGLKNRPDNNGKLTISVSKQQEHIEYIIEDNGVGRDALKNGAPRGAHSYGMEMSQDRVRFFNSEDNASVVVTDLKHNGEAAGTKIQVRLKIQ